jgi:hypothetical protein
MTTIRTLPREIVDNIIEYLDTKSMCEASLICKAWDEASSCALAWRSKIEELEIKIPKNKHNLRSLYVRKMKRQKIADAPQEAYDKFRNALIYPSNKSCLVGIFACALFSVTFAAIFSLCLACVIREELARKAEPIECIVNQQQTKIILCNYSACFEGIITCSGYTGTDLQTSTITKVEKDIANLNGFFLEYQNGTNIPLDVRSPPVAKGKWALVIVFGTFAVISAALMIFPMVYLIIQCKRGTCCDEDEDYDC